jgi:hypothetical protein
MNVALKGGGNMRYLKNEMLCGIRIVAMVSMILLGAAAVTCADGPVLIIFSPGTTIQSSQVNQNFSALLNALPGFKWVMGANNFSFTTDWQTVAQISVTAPADGNFLIFVNTQVSFNLQPNGGNMVTFGISTSPSINNLVAPGQFGVNFVAPCTSCGPALSVPANIVGTASASNGVTATFYLLAKKEQNTTDIITLASASMFTVFLPKQW